MRPPACFTQMDYVTRNTGVLQTASREHGLILRWHRSESPPPGPPPGPPGSVQGFACPALRISRSHVGNSPPAGRSISSVRRHRSQTPDTPFDSCLSVDI